MAQGCVMTWTQCHTSEVKVTVYAWGKIVSLLIVSLNTSNMQLCQVLLKFKGSRFYKKMHPCWIMRCWIICLQWMLHLTYIYACVNIMLLQCRSVADPEGPLPGGVTKSARSAAAGGGYPLLQVGVRGASPGKIFEKWMQMVHSEPIFCRVRVDYFPKNCV